MCSSDLSGDARSALTVLEIAAGLAEAVLPGIRAALTYETGPAVLHLDASPEALAFAAAAEGRALTALAASSGGALDGLPFSLPTRIGEPGAETSPEELLAAAHAGCYAMALTSVLTNAEVPPGRLAVRCRIALDEDPERHRSAASSSARSSSSRSAITLASGALEGSVEPACRSRR